MVQASDFNQPLVARPTHARVIAWVSIAFFLFCAVMAWRAGQGDVSPFFLLFVVLGIYLLVSVGTVEITPAFVTYKTPWATYAISWDEVERVEIDAQRGALALIGDNKRVVTIGPAYWSGKDKRQLLALFKATIEKRSIPIISTQKVLFKLSKNARVR